MTNEITTINAPAPDLGELVVVGLPVLRRINDKSILPLAEHPYVIYMTHYTNADSRVTMRRALRLAAETILGETCDPSQFAWWNLRRAHVMMLVARMSERERDLAPATINRVRVAVRGVLRECFRAAIMSAEDYERAIDVEAVGGSREASGRALDADELTRLRAACDASTELGVRDLAVIDLLVNSGMRRKEATNLNYASYHRQTLQFIGKGNKQRSVHVNAAMAARLDAWIAIRGTEPGPLFHPFSPQGKMQRSRRLSYSGMQAAVLAVAKRAGVDDISLHDFRRTLISDLLDEGTDIVTVAKIVGHASTDTTAKYDRRSERAARDALERHGRNTKEPGP